jgi:EAL domain-containing protein (putative c-di-GMP-specific phosphodiesterase class I)
VKTKTLVGLEALTRGLDDDGNVIPPARLFPRAIREGVAVELEHRCRRLAMATFSQQIPHAAEMLLFVNLDLSLSSGPEDASRLAAAARHWALPTHTIVVEVLESRFEDTDALTATMNRFRQRGFLLALDDMGAGHSDLNRVPLIHPDVIKVDRELIRNIDSDHYKQGVFKALVHLGRRIGALIVAEGVETRDETLTALELGADLLQGYYVARPHPADKLRFGEIERSINTLADDFKRHMIDRISEQKQRHQQYDAMLQPIICNLSSAPLAHFDAILTAAVPAFLGVECMFVLDQHGIQVSATTCRPGLPLRGNRILFRPAPCGTDHSLKDYYYLLRNVELEKFTTDPYVSMATGHLCRTISICFRNADDQQTYILCVDVAE